MSARSTRFASLNNRAANTKHVLYTVPAGKVALVKTFAVKHYQGTTKEFYVYARSGGVDLFLGLWNVETGVGRTFIDLHYVLTAGESFVIEANYAVDAYGFHVHAAGMLLDA